MAVLLPFSVLLASCKKETESEPKVTINAIGFYSSFFLAGYGSVTIDWGDRTKIETHTLKSYDQNSPHGGFYSHDYYLGDLLDVHTITLTGKGITYFESSSGITSLDLNSINTLVYLYCLGIRGQTSLDLSNNTSLYTLEWNGILTSLDISKNFALRTLDCSVNKLTSLDLSNNTMLENLYCQNNQLTNLDVSRNTELRSYYCYQNQLTNLDVSRNTSLNSLDCSYNLLTSLDLSANTGLRYFTCNNNQLTSLNMSNNTAIIILECSSNNLTTEALDALFETLHDNTPIWYSKRIIIGNNPGAADCDRSIATDKGWIVDD